MVCYQKQIRISKKEQDIQNKVIYPKFNIKDAVIKPISLKEARNFILEYEYLGSMSTRIIQCFGLFYDNILSGAIVFSLPPSKGVTESILGKDKKDIVCVLSRGACAYWAHPHSGSKLISFGTNWMSLHTQYKCFIAYGDPNADEIGTLYQACNWMYTGQTESKTEYFLNNKWVSGYEFRLKGKKESLPLAVPTRKGSSKHRYVYIKGQNKRETKLIRKLLKLTVLPYPKRNNPLSCLTSFHIREEDTTKRNIIYRFTNKVNNKIYIGQTTQAIPERYFGLNLTSKRTSGSILQNAAIKYGNDSFVVDILYESPYSDRESIIKDLNQKEQYFINLFQATINGYNIREGGNNHCRSEEEKKKLSEAQVKKKSYIREYCSPGGEKVTVLNLSGFCKENNLDFSAMQKVSTGKKYSYKGWRKWDKDKGKYSKKESLLQYSKSKGKTYRLTKNNEPFLITNLKKFSEENNLNYSNLKALTQKRIKRYAGFELLTLTS